MKGPLTSYMVTIAYRTSTRVSVWSGTIAAPTHIEALAKAGAKARRNGWKVDFIHAL